MNISELKPYFERIDENFKKIDQRFDRVEQRLDHVENKVDNLTVEMIEMNEKIDSVVEALEFLHNTLRSDISRLESKTDFRMASIVS